nr:helix-turn-helix transcriptional regulator [uncultured Draconibacterium sp.]
MSSLRIKEIIKEKGLSIKDVSEIMGINRVGLSKHINGNPSVEVLEKIAAALAVPVTDLFEQPQSNEFTCPNCGTRLTVGEK